MQYRLRRAAGVLMTGGLLGAGPAAALEARAADDRLEEVVVTASGFEQSVVDAPASITILSREVLTGQRSHSLTEALADVEGIDTGDTAGKTGGLNISLRGMPSDYTLVLIDGRRQNAAGNVTPNGFGETSTSFLPPLASIERIEVVRGPMSTLYGSDAMGGVVNIITRKVRDDWSAEITPDVTIQQNSGFGGSHAVNLYADGPLVSGRLGLALRGSYFHRDASELEPTGETGAGTAISRRGPSPVEADLHSIGARLSFTPGERHDLWLDFEQSEQEYDNSEAQLGTLDQPDATPPTFNGYGPRLQFNRDQYTLAHTMRLKAGALDSSVTRNTTETLGRTLPAGTPGGPPGSGAPNKLAGAARTLEARNTIFDTKLNAGVGAHTFTLGGQYWDARMVDGVALQPFEHTQWSIFAEDEWRFAERLALTLGVRHDDHSTFGGHVSPRAYLVWNASDAWTFKGGVSQGFKTPRLEQLQEGITGFTAQGRTATIGSPGLTPETSTSTELAAHYTRASGFRASATLFNNDFDDKIASGTPVPNCSFALNPGAPGCVDYGSFPAQESFSQSINIDKAVTRGGELATTVPIGGSWSLKANYTYTRSEQKSGSAAGQPLVNTPKHMANASLRWEVTPRANAWLRGEYRSERYRTPGIARDALGDYKAWAQLHLGGALSVAPNVTLNATIYNLLDEDFLEYAAYETATGGLAYTNVYNNMQEGRRLWLSANFLF